MAYLKQYKFFLVVIIILILLNSFLVTAQSQLAQRVGYHAPLYTSALVDYTGNNSPIVIFGGAVINGRLDLNNNKITRVANPTQNQDVATKFYVDNQIGSAVGGISGSKWTDGSGDNIHRLLGNVGIGTSTPTSKLDVSGHAIIRGHLNMNNNRIMNLAWPDADTDAATRAYVDDVFSSLESNGESGSNWVLSGNNVYRASGNVGIGTDSPAQMLHVSGNVRASGFCIDDDCIISWPTGNGTGGGTGNVTGSGTMGYIPRWIDTTTLGTSVISQVGDRIGIGTTSPRTGLEVGGHIILTGNHLYFDSGAGVFNTGSDGEGIFYWRVFDQASGNYPLRGDRPYNDLMTLERTSAGDVELNVKGDLVVDDKLLVKNNVALAFEGGNVGIGGASGSETLLVHGDVHVAADLSVDGDIIVTGEVRTVYDECASPPCSTYNKLWGERRPGVLVMEECSHGSTKIGRGSVAVPWYASSSGCPAGTWVCRNSWDIPVNFVCNSGGGTRNRIKCDGDASSTHNGWLADTERVFGSYRGMAKHIRESATYIVMVCQHLPVWCCWK